MKVLKCKKLRGNKYLIIFDNYKEVELYEEVILKYELLLNKDIDNNMENLLEENRLWDCYYSAINYLKFKNRSVFEVKNKLKKDYNEKEIDFVINKLCEQKYLDDYLYASNLFNEKILVTLHGPNLIKNDLLKKGISKEIISMVVDNYNQEIQYEKINKIINKMLKSNKDKGNLYMKRKIYNYLCYQGFDNNIIKEVMDNIEFGNDTLIKKKEEEKLRLKLSNKYSGSELEYMVKQHLIRKGFN